MIRATSTVNGGSTIDDAVIIEASWNGGDPEYYAVRRGEVSKYAAMWAQYNCVVTPLPEHEALRVAASGRFIRIKDASVPGIVAGWGGAEIGYYPSGSTSSTPSSPQFDT